MDAQPEISPTPISFIARLIGVIAWPGRTFANISRHPRFFAPFLATLFLFGGFWYVVYWKLGLAGLAAAVVQYVRRGTLVSQDEIDYTLQYSRGLAPLILMGGAATILAHLLFVAVIANRLGNLFLGVKVRMRVALSVACYAYLAKAVVETLLGIPMVLYGDINGLNFGNLLPTNFAFFLDSKDFSRIVYEFLHSLDAVQFWYFTLLGIGMSAESDDPSAPAFMGICLAALWIILNVLSAAVGDFIFKS